MNKSFFLSLSFLILLLAACKATKDITTDADSITSKALSKKMKENAFDFEEFSGKARVSFQDNTQKVSFTATIRMKKDETIWMSLTGPFSIEGGRVLMGKDKVEILDKLNNKYYNQPFDYIDSYLPISADLSLIQNLLIGNPFEDNLSKQIVEINEGKYLAKGDFNGIETDYIISPENYRYEQVTLVDALNAREGKMTFSDYQTVDEQDFAMKRTIEMQDAQNHVYIEIDFTRAKLDKDLTFPFKIPDKFERIEE